MARLSLGPILDTGLHCIQTDIDIISHAESLCCQISGKLFVFNLYHRNGNRITRDILRYNYLHQVIIGRSRELDALMSVTCVMTDIGEETDRME